VRSYLFLKYACGIEKVSKKRGECEANGGFFDGQLGETLAPSNPPEIGR
jgi:hypothetical protein